MVTYEQTSQFGVLRFVWALIHDKAGLTMKVMACLREHEIAALPFCLFSVAARFVPLALPFEVG